MVEFIEIVEKDSKVQNQISQTIGKYVIESYAAQSKTGRNVLIQSKAFEQAIKIMGGTIEDIDLEVEQKDKKIEILENKTGLRLPQCKVNDEMN